MKGKVKYSNHEYFLQINLSSAPISSFTLNRAEESNCKISATSKSFQTDGNPATCLPFKSVYISYLKLILHHTKRAFRDPNKIA